MAFINLLLSGLSLLMSILFFITGEWLFGFIMFTAVFYFNNRRAYHKGGKKTYIWVCPKCKTRNSSDIMACIKCGTHR